MALGDADRVLANVVNSDGDALRVDAGLTIDGDIEIGAVELKNATDDTRAKVSAAVLEGDNALAVHDGALGTTTDAAVTTNAAGTLSAKLRGLVSLIASLVHAEDSAASSGHQGLLALAVRRDTPGVTTDADGDYSELQVSSTGRLRVTLDRSGTATDTADQTVDNTGGGVTILAANANRRGATVQNTGAATIRVTVDGTAPTTTKGLQLAAGAVLSLSMPDCPTSAIKAIREGGSNSTVYVSEVV
jgi:hypothetical protein